MKESKVLELVASGLNPAPDMFCLAHTVYLNYELLSKRQASENVTQTLVFLKGASIV